MIAQEKFYNKLLSEYKDFLGNLRDMPAGKIIGHAYEKVIKEEIVSCFGGGKFLNNEQVLQLYALNIDLDGLYNNYMKMDVSISEVLEDCTDYFIEERLEALPGQEIEGGNVHGYAIKRAVLYDNDRGFAYAHNPNAVSPYVTWQLTNDNGTLDYYWSKYCNDEGDALANFVEMTNDYILTNGVKEKPLPEVDAAPPPKAGPEERCIYKVEINNPDEPAFPNFQVFSAQNDTDAVKEAYEICNEREDTGAYLLEVHELDDDYNIIRKIDLRRHNPGLRRFMDIDLIDFLGQIADKTIVHYPNDWNIDKETLHRAAISDDPEQKRLMWHVCSYGTHLNTERDTFIKDTGAFNTRMELPAKR